MRRPHLGPWVRLLALATALAACQPPSAGGRGATRVPSADDFQGITLEPLEIRPRMPSAATYGGQDAHALTPIEAAIAQRLAREGFVELPALSAMARELAEVSPDQLSAPPSLVDGLMARAGLIYPPPQLVVVELGGDGAGCDLHPARDCEPAVGSIADQTATILAAQGAQQQPQPPQFGVGVVKLSNGRTRMMVAVVRPAVVLEPVEVIARSGASFLIRGRLLGARTQPVVEIVDADGAWAPVPVALSVDGSFSATMSCGRDGAHQVEVLAEGEHGPEVVANFPVYCGSAPPDVLRVVVERIDPAVTADQLARANFIYLNTERERRGLRALVWDPDVARVARNHSEDMRAHGFVGHRSPRTGDVTQRFARAGIKGTVVRENAARGYGPKGIHDSLMRSPGHRSNMLATDVTHVGVGAVLGDAEADVQGAPRPVFATQNMYKRPGAGAPPDGALASTLRSRVDALRREAGLSPVGWDDALAEAAARGAAAARGGRELPAATQTQVFDLGFVSLQSSRLASADFDALSTVELWREDISGAVGLAVIRVRATRTADAGFLAIILVAERP